MTPGLLSSWQRRWNGFWFAPGSPYNLAVARIAVAGTALWIFLSRDFSGVSALPRDFWLRTSLFTEWRYLLFPGHPVLEGALQDLTIVALACAVLGILPRTCCLLSGLLLYHFGPAESIIWASTATLRGFEIPQLALIALALSPCGDALSVWPGGQGRKKSAEDSWSYQWPVRLIQAQLCFLYFFSAYSKLVECGVRWASPENMRNWLLTLTQNDQIQGFTLLGPWLLRHPLFYVPFGVVALLLEFSFPVTLFSRRAAAILVPAAVFMHIVILLAMNIVVLYPPIFLVFADWSFLGSILGRRASERDRAVELSPGMLEHLSG